MTSTDSDILDFNKLYTEYHKRFLYFASTYLKDKNAIEDIVADSFTYYWENKGSLKNESNIPAYILKTVKHKCLNYLNAQKIKLKANNDINDLAARVLQARILSLEACDPSELFSDEVNTIMQKVLSSLPEKTSMIFRMSRIDNKSNKDIANQMALSVKSVEFHVSKALKLLRLRMKDYFVILLLMHWM
jgi:RNA polymerase sigma-70 factor, ECF subfamily